MEKFQFSLVKRHKLHLHITKLLIHKQIMATPRMPTPQPTTVSNSLVIFTKLKEFKNYRPKFKLQKIL